jgi:hypothetical protein
LVCATGGVVEGKKIEEKAGGGGGGNPRGGGGGGGGGGGVERLTAVTLKVSLFGCDTVLFGR